MANPNPSPATRFKPGQAPGPGRPRGSVSITSRLRAQLERETRDKAGNPTGRQVADVLASVLLDRALKGDLRAAREVVLRIDGRVPVAPPPPPEPLDERLERMVAEIYGEDPSPESAD